MAGFALPWFAPIVLIKLGRTNDAQTYATNYLRLLQGGEPAQEYKNYFDAVQKLLEQKQSP